MEWGAAVTAIITLIIALMKWWQSRQPERDQENRYDAIQQGRNDIANGDVDAVNGRIDRLLSDVSLPTTGTASDGSGQQHGADSTAEGISDLLGTKIVLR